MQLTDEQKASIERQRRENPDSRLRIELTEEQRREYQLAVAAEQSGRDDNIARLRNIEAAEKAAGFSGDLRRAIRDQWGPAKYELADRIGVERELFEKFRAGDADLPSGAVDRLVELLGLQLTPVADK
jgi:hypothetical protein